MTRLCRRLHFCVARAARPSLMTPRSTSAKTWITLRTLATNRIIPDKREETMPLIERLRVAREPYRSSKIYEEARAHNAMLDAEAKIESDARVIADLTRRLEDTAYPLGEINDLTKVIAALRKAVAAAIDRFEGCGMRYGAAEIRKLCGD